MSASEKLVMQLRGKPLYRKSQREASWFGKGAFKWRFPEIQNSLVNKNFISIICTFIGFRLRYQNLSWPSNSQELQRQLPILRNPSFDAENDKITYTWIGHSTAVISVGKQANFIIDPVFSDRCSPFQFIGPKRFRDPACQIKDLPPINAVFVSHDHYDHMDSNSLELLHKKDNPIFFAGLDSESCFPKNADIRTLDWTETETFFVQGYSFKVTFVPVCHWSKRGMFQKNTRLWGGFVIETPKGKKIFFAGDTGYCGIFKEIGEVFGEIDLAIIPIGAYLPREGLIGQHVDPEQAVLIHKDIRSHKSVGVHWGTFPLGMQMWCAARRDLHQAKLKHGLKDDQFITVQHGGSFRIDYK